MSNYTRLNKKKEKVLLIVLVNSMRVRPCIDLVFTWLVSKKYPTNKLKEESTLNVIIF